MTFFEAETNEAIAFGLFIGWGIGALIGILILCFNRKSINKLTTILSIVSICPICVIGILWLLYSVSVYKY